MLTELISGSHVVGAKQTGRAIADAAAAAVFLAEDADPKITEPIAKLAHEQNVPVEMVATMKQLGAACSIAVGAAVAALLK
ncbi:MAG: ribosomal L7Ae/L30e/S12e/Gadd45 family protein [Oscillospiraceae bacterium]